MRDAEIKARAAEMEEEQQRARAEMTRATAELNRSMVRICAFSCSFFFLYGGETKQGKQTTEHCSPAYFSFCLSVG